jgi:NADH:ubiquinone oxidoreductase subunit H
VTLTPSGDFQVKTRSPFGRSGPSFNPSALAWWRKPLVLLSTLSGALFGGEGPRILAREAIGTANLLLKAFFLYFVMIWVRWTLPRIRIDQVMYLCLKVLLPIAVACVLFAMFQVVLWP